MGGGINRFTYQNPLWRPFEGLVCSGGFGPVLHFPFTFPSQLFTNHSTSKNISKNISSLVLSNKSKARIRGGGTMKRNYMKYTKGKLIWKQIEEKEGRTFMRMGQRIKYVWGVNHDA